MFKAAKIYLAFSIVTISFVTSFSFQARGQNTQANSPVAEDLNRQAILRIYRKEFKEAIELLTRAVAIDRSFADGHLNLGTAYVLSDQPETGIGYLKRGLELDPESYKGHNQLGVAYDKLNKHDLAVESLTRAVELKPDYALGYFNLGAAYLWGHRLKPAEIALQKAAKLDPANSEVKLYLGALYVRQKKYSEAVAEVKRVTKAHPNDEQASLMLCKIYLLADDRESALNMYQSFKTVNAPLADLMFRSIFSDRVISAPNPDDR